MRLIFMGSQALAEGFALLGFEIFQNATVEIVENELAILLKSKEKALVFIEDTLTQKHAGSFFLRARTESDRIIMTEIPPLSTPETYRPSVEDLLVRVLGTSALDSPT